MTRPCIGCGRLTSARRCSPCQRAWDARRNARPSRAIYGGSWPAESRRLRREQPWCSVCYTTRDLTVDHPTRAVLCRSDHNRLEEQRKRTRREQGGPRETGRLAVTVPAPTAAAVFVKSRFPIANREARD